MNIQLLYITCASLTEAESLGRGLLSAKMAGCVNIIPGVKAIYPWEDRLAESHEVLLIVKTTTAHVAAATAFIKQRHSYKVPCVLAVAADAANGEYAAWLTSNLNA